MSDNRMQRIVKQAQKIAACEREIANLVEMITLLNTQISSCRLIVQDLQHCTGVAPVDEDDTSTTSTIEPSNIRACGRR